ncbi:family 3 encapsulin nanocompartment shell protein [Streptomyces scabiei]|uniref:family 3 encapsulin nanocompartment shell protein n=1 Tax=Streptomyces scabiei TaxID=1930 RepID=UPI0029B336E8|nr:family 3 encapsulin nanocompartment shell protein [Streptomyces scabiei]MDX3523611.1 family 3 encapsulin nanocompartment shell protein [Streptomyces scabiei]
MTTTTADTAPPTGTGTIASPGEQFARAFAEDPEKAEVRFDHTITDSFQPGKDRPRLTARNLFKKQRVTSDTVRSWFETRPNARAAPNTPHASGVLRESAYRFEAATYGVRPITAWVQIPEALGEQPDALAQFIDHRLMVRLGTAENRALTLDVVDHPDVATLPYTGSYTAGVLAAFNEIEQQGGTGHALMINPQDYYGELVGAGSLLADLAREQVMICRHRHVAPGSALVGDFAMAARLLDAGRSVIKVAEPPPGLFERPGTAVYAEVHESVAVHQPTHFFHAVRA